MDLTPEAASDAAETSAALVSGRAGRAIVRTEDGSFYLIDVDHAPQPCNGAQWMHLRGLHPDALLLPAPGYPFGTVQEELRRRWTRDRAVRLLLTALDADHATELRARACQAADSLLEDFDVAADVLETMLSAALPADVDLKGALVAAGDAGLNVPILLRELSDVELAERVRRAWQEALRGMTPEERAEATRACEKHHGLTRLVSIARHPYDFYSGKRLIDLDDPDELIRLATRPTEPAIREGTDRPPTPSATIASEELRSVFARRLAERNTVAGMVQVAGTTYRIALLAQGVFEVTRILDDRVIGHFQALPEPSLTPTAVDRDALSVIAEAAASAIKRVRAAVQQSMPANAHQRGR